MGLPVGSIIQFQDSGIRGVVTSTNENTSNIRTSTGGNQQIRDMDLNREYVVVGQTTLDQREQAILQEGGSSAGSLAGDITGQEYEDVDGVTIQDIERARQLDQRFTAESYTPTGLASAPASSMFGEGIIPGEIPPNVTLRNQNNFSPDLVPIASSERGPLFVNRQDLIRAEREAKQFIAERQAEKEIASDPRTLPAQFFSPVDPFFTESLSRVIGSPLFGKDPIEQIGQVRQEFARQAVQRAKTNKTERELFITGASEFAVPSIFAGATVVTGGSGLIPNVARAGFTGLGGLQIGQAIVQPTPSSVGGGILAGIGLVGLRQTRVPRETQRIEPFKPQSITRKETLKVIEPKSPERLLLETGKFEPFLRSDATIGLRLKGLFADESPANRIASQREFRNIFEEVGGKHITVEPEPGRPFGTVDMFAFREIRVTPKKPETFVKPFVEPKEKRIFTLKDVVGEPKRDEGFGSGRQQLILRRPRQEIRQSQELVQVPKFLQSPKNRLIELPRQKRVVRQRQLVRSNQRLQEPLISIYRQTRRSRQPVITIPRSEFKTRQGSLDILLPKERVIQNQIQLPNFRIRQQQKQDFKTNNIIIPALRTPQKQNNSISNSFRLDQIQRPTLKMDFPSSIGSFRLRGNRSRQPRQPRQYSPTLIARELNITAPIGSRSKFTVGEIRPILVRRRRRN